jgi:putative MFS transporter
MFDGAAADTRSGSSWVGEALDGVGSWSLRAKAPWLLGLLMLFDSWDSTVIAYVLPVLREHWSLSGLQSGWLASAGYGGQFLGAIVFGSVAERHGRLPVFKPLVLVMCLLAVGCSLASRYDQLIIFRAVQGLTIGGALPIAICYINEVAPTATRGRFFGTFQFLMTSGFGLAALASAWLIPAFGWRIMFGLGAAPLIALPFTLLLPESPRWLAGRGRIDEAARSLERLGSGPLPAADAWAAPRREGDLSPASSDGAAAIELATSRDDASVPTAIGARVTLAMGASVPTPAGVQAPLAIEGSAPTTTGAVMSTAVGARTELSVPTATDVRAPIAMLFARDVRTTSIITALLWFLTYFVSFGLVTWIPSIYVSMFKIPVADALRYNAIVAVSVFILPIILRQTIDRIGRRPLPMLGTAIGGIALMAMIFVDLDARFWLVGLAIVGQIGISIGSMVLWPYTAETYATRIRSLALGTSSSIARAASMLTPLLVGGVLQATGSVTLIFLVFGAASFVVALLWLFGARETAGQKMTD